MKTVKKIGQYVLICTILLSVIFSGWPHIFGFPQFVQEVRAVETVVDATILDGTDEYGPSPSVVFTSDLVGYMFYIDATSQDLGYSKTTDGGVTWGARVVIDTTLAGWTSVAVWYDQWTPGDTTGTKIHIAASDDVSADIYYTFLNTGTDSLKGSMVATVLGTALTEASVGPPSITKGAGGALFITGNFTTTAGGKVAKSTDGAGAVWTEITPASWSAVAIDQIQLLPLLTDNDIIAVRADTTNNDIDSRVYDEVTDTWDGAWTSIAALTESTTYDQWFSGSIKKSTGDVYLAFANQTNNAANDIAFWSFTDTGRTWSQGADIMTNSASTMMPVTLVDETDSDIYVAYLRGTVEADMAVYYKKSTDGGVSWSDESVQLQGFKDDYKGLRGNLMSSVRLGVVYYDDDDNDIFFTSIFDGIEVSIDESILDATDEYGASPSVVFTSDQVGYVFYIDAASLDLAYRKTTDGGKNWSNASVVIDTVVTGWTTVSVWYDRWTPGDTTGTKIHIAVSDDTSDDIYYTFLDTAADTLKGSVVAAVLGATLTESSDGPPSITKGAGGALFIYGNFTTTAGGGVAKSTDGAGAVWANITPGSWSSVALDQMQLVPLLTDNDVMLIWADTGVNTIYSRVYDEVTDTWDGAWTSIGALTENTTYDQWFSASTKKSTGDVYLSFANNINNTGNDIAFWSYSDSTRTWTQKTDIITNSATVMMPAPLIDENDGDIYVAYLRGTLASNMQVYYKKSTDGGTSWGSESSSLSPAVLDDHKALRGNFLSTDRLYAVWHNDDLNDLMGNTIADIWSWDLSAYRWFANANSADVGAPLEAQDTAATLENSGDAFRLRILLHNVGQTPLSGENLKLQFAEKSGTCDTAFAGETYADVTGVTDIAFSTANTPSDGDSLVANANDPTHGGHTIVNQDYEEANNFTNSVAVIPSGQDGKWDFSLIDNGAPGGTTYCFRVVESGGDVIDTYTVIPEMTVFDDGGAGPQTLTFSLSDNTIGFGTISSGEGRYATGSGSGTNLDVVDAHTISAATNASSGYTITVQGTTLTCASCGDTTITAIGDVAVASAPGTEQFGIRLIKNSGTGTVIAPYNGAMWAFDTLHFPDVVATGDGDGSTSEYGVRYMGNIAADTEAGSYTSVLTYTITATF